MSTQFGRPIVAVALFNGVMVVWHLPAVFDWHMQHTWSTEVLMEPSFLLTGYLFWRLILNGPGLPARARSRVAALSVLVTALVMLVLAMWMSIGARAPWYFEPVQLHGEVAALRDQHYAAGVLWVCGDLWAIPALVLITLRAVEARGGPSTLVDHFSKRGG
jgi:cytochrome c oxidase assembly factor CtaG